MNRLLHSYILSLSVATILFVLQSVHYDSGLFLSINRYSLLLAAMRLVLDLVIARFLVFSFKSLLGIYSEEFAIPHLIIFAMILMLVDVLFQTVSLLVIYGLKFNTIIWNINYDGALSGSVMHSFFPFLGAFITFIYSYRKLNK